MIVPRVVLACFSVVYSIVALLLFGAISYNHVYGSQELGDNLCKHFCWVDKNIIGANYREVDEILTAQNFHVEEIRYERTGAIFYDIYGSPDSDYLLARLTVHNNTVGFLDAFFDEPVCLAEVIAIWGIPARVVQHGKNIIYLYEQPYILVYARESTPQSVKQIHYTRETLFSEFEAITEAPSWRSVRTHSLIQFNPCGLVGW